MTLAPPGTTRDSPTSLKNFKIFSKILFYNVKSNGSEFSKPNLKNDSVGSWLATVIPKIQKEI